MAKEIDKILLERVSSGKFFSLLTSAEGPSR